MVGRTLSHYKVLEELSRGGMGIVYRALDLKLDREVALKVLPPELVADPERKRRFVQEAKAAAKLNHPHIGMVFEIDDADGTTFIAMELIEGEKLKDLINKERPPLTRALELATEVAEGLARAHDKGIVHRDLKPANVMVTEDGHAKIIDFGLAKLVEPLAGEGSDVETAIRGETDPGKVMGTVSYMSPEQARGEIVDHRSDIFSFGIVLYEMLSGKPPFRRPSGIETLNAILKETASPLPALGSEVPVDAASDLQQLIQKCLAKEADDRIQSMREVGECLKSCRAGLSEPIKLSGQIKAMLLTVRQPRIAVPVVLVLLAVSALGYWLLQRAGQARWARTEAIPGIISLVNEGDFDAAFALASRAELYMPNDPLLLELWPQISRDVSIVTEPSDANIYFKKVLEPNRDWQYLGRSPIEATRFPLGGYRWKIEKEGYETIEAFNETLTDLVLSPKGSIPPDMVRVPPSDVSAMVQTRLTGEDSEESIRLEEFLIDRFEVTNRQFEAFVDAGGYQNQQYWKHTFMKDGRILTWEQATAEFRDATGRPGPAMWELGDYPDGEDGFPVTGVSWYEAAAYAEFAGKSLPTIYHWYRAARAGLGEYILPLSNFGGDGPAPVGGHDAISPYGVYDMAGNVREWCWNESRGHRYILGGAWNDPLYMFSWSDVASPFDRSPTNGFRCVRYVGMDRPMEATARPLDLSIRDYDKEEQVSDAIFEIYKNQFSYDRTEMNAEVEEKDESPEHWTIEKISFDAAYGNERMMAYLILPKAATPPYQTVILYPGSGSVGRRDPQTQRTQLYDYIVKSGRAVMFPTYKGTYERYDGVTYTWPTPTHRYKEEMIKWVKDFKRSVDYLESRDDIDLERLAYVGFSWGGRLGAIIPAVEERLRVGVLLLGGLASGIALPEVDQINYVSRVTIPILMLNGRYDGLEPLETAQRSMLRLLGTPEEHKRHVIYETAHRLPRNESIKETLDWLDFYLGPVQTK